MKLKGKYSFINHHFLKYRGVISSSSPKRNQSRLKGTSNLDGLAKRSLDKKIDMNAIQKEIE